MPDIINSSFDPRLPFPLDVRQQVQDMNALYAIPNTSRWEGMVVYVKGAQIPYILKGGIDNSFWVPFQFNGGGGILPNGIVVYGEAQQSGNNILLNDAWVWRIDQVDYQSSDDTIAITPAASGNLRVDIIVGDNLSNFVLVEGDEVASPGPAIEPNIPADTVPLLRVEVNDTGITAFEEFALSAFVRFDIADQGLIPSQRANARTNIQALARDVADTHTGQLTQEGNITLNGVQATSAGQANLRILSGRANSDSNHRIVRIYNGDGVEETELLVMDNRGGIDFNVTVGSLWRFLDRGTLVLTINRTGHIDSTVRSNSATTLTRRDELYLTYPVTIGGTGKLNDVALADGVGEIKFSSGVTEVSGIDANGDTKELLIWSDNPDGITLPAEDVLSIAANRFHREVNIPYQTWVKVVYDGDLARWVNSNTGELQEVDDRYFEVIEDVLTLKYVLPNEDALSTFVRGSTIAVKVVGGDYPGDYKYVSEVDFVGVPDYINSFPAQDGGYWVSYNKSFELTESLILTTVASLYRTIADSYTKTEVDGLVVAGIKAIQPASADDGISGIKFPTESGTYTNYGGIVVDLTEGLTIIFSDGAGTFTKSVIPIDLTDYATVDQVEWVPTLEKNIEEQVNIVKRTDIIKGVYNSTGVINTTSDNWICTKKIPILESTEYTANPIQTGGSNNRICFYDSDGVFISAIAVTVQPFTFTTPAGTGLIGANIDNRTGIGLNPLDPAGYGNTFQIELGASAAPYQDPEDRKVLGSRVVGISPDTLTKINEESAKIDFLIGEYDPIMRFDGTAQATISPEITLNAEGDYVEFIVRVGSGFTDFYDGLGLAGKGNSTANVFGFYTVDSMWLRQSVGGSYLVFSGLTNTFELSTIRLEAGSGVWELYQNGVLIGSETKTGSLVINNIGNGYDLTNKAIVDIQSILLNHSGGLTEISSVSDFATTENIISTYTNKDQDEDLEFRDVYVSFDPTGFAGNEIITVFVKRKGKSTYTGYEIRHEINMDPLVYLDYWRIAVANEFFFNGTSMTLISNNVLVAGESEFTMLVDGKVDHTGGIHGDELVTDIDFYINGVKKTFSTAFELLPCDSFFYIERSTLHETMNSSEPTTPIPGHPIVANHIKHTTFGDGEYNVKNQIEFTAVYTIDRLYTGISCIGKIQATEGFNEWYEEAEFTQSNSNKLSEIDRREFYCNNPTTDFSGFATSKLIVPIADDPLCQMFVWDRTNDSKYYRHTPTRTTSIGETWKTEMNVTFK